MEFNFFGKTKKAPKSNPFLNKTRRYTSSKEFREELRKEEEIVRHSIPKDMPSALKVLYAKKNPSNPDDLREVITHIQFPEDDHLRKASKSNIEKGLKMGYLITHNDLNSSLDHLFTRNTVTVYANCKDIYETRTIFWFPKAIFYGSRRYYIAQDVAHYVQFVEDLRAERIAKRELGYLVPQKVRTQPEMENVVKKKNISKFKVGAKKVFNFFTRRKA
jgi:hypothetical protein